MPRNVILSFAALCLTTLLPILAHASVRIQIIDRGQADGILIRTPNDKWIVIDGGTNKQQSLSMKNSWDVDEVALVIVSHRHSDHQRGVVRILKDFKVERFLGLLED